MGRLFTGHPGLARASIRSPTLALTGMLLLTALAAPGLLRLELRTDGHALVPRDDPAVRLDAEIRRQFDLRDAIVVYVESSHPDGIYNRVPLDRVLRPGEIS